MLIGLAGVSFAASSTALARRAEFGMLRHVGMLRRQVVGMLAGEGILMSLFGVAYGLALGAVLSLVLVYVINRQSFNWSIDLAVPYWQLGVISVVLVAAAAQDRPARRRRTMALRRAARRFSRRRRCRAGRARQIGERQGRPERRRSERRRRRQDQCPRRDDRGGRQGDTAARILFNEDRGRRRGGVALRLRRDAQGRNADADGLCPRRRRA